MAFVINGASGNSWRLSANLDGSLLIVFNNNSPAPIALVLQDSITFVFYEIRATATGMLADFVSALPTIPTVTGIPLATSDPNTFYLLRIFNGQLQTDKNLFGWGPNSNALAPAAKTFTSAQYLQLITSEHNQRPKFMAAVAALIQPMVDMQNLLAGFSTLFNILQAAGQRLDMIGNWVGIARTLAIPIQNSIYFSLNVAGLGFGQGIWLGPGSSLTGYVTLGDAQYRILLAARIASNMWDGTVPGAYAIWNIVFSFVNIKILIQDNQDMSISIIFLSSSIDPVTQSLLVNGYIAVRPAGVRIAGYFLGNPPIFGFGPTSSIIAGFGTGRFLSTTQIA